MSRLSRYAVVIKLMATATGGSYFGRLNLFGARKRNNQMMKDEEDYVAVIQSFETIANCLCLFVICFRQHLIFFGLVFYKYFAGVNFKKLKSTTNKLLKKRSALFNSSIPCKAHARTRSYTHIYKHTHARTHKHTNSDGPIIQKKCL